MNKIPKFDPGSNTLEQHSPNTFEEMVDARGPPQNGADGTEQPLVAALDDEQLPQDTTEDPPEEQAPSPLPRDSSTPQTEPLLLLEDGEGADEPADDEVSNGGSSTLALIDSLESSSVLKGLNAEGTISYVGFDDNALAVSRDEAHGADATNTDTFTYSVSDGNGGSDSATVTVTGVNDALSWGPTAFLLVRARR